MSEKLYDEVIAPKLKEIGDLCVKNGIPLFAFVEYEPGKTASTSFQTNDECIEMVMVRHCAKTAPNVDGYIIGLSRWAKKHNVDVSGSMVLKPYVPPANE